VLFFLTSILFNFMASAGQRINHSFIRASSIFFNHGLYRPDTSNKSILPQILPSPEGAAAPPVGITGARKIGLVYHKTAKIPQ